VTEEDEDDGDDEFKRLDLIAKLKDDLSFQQENAEQNNRRLCSEITLLRNNLETQGKDSKLQIDQIEKKNEALRTKMNILQKNCDTFQQSVSTHERTCTEATEKIIHLQNALNEAEEHAAQVLAEKAETYDQYLELKSEYENNMIKFQEDLLSSNKQSKDEGYEEGKENAIKEYEIKINNIMKESSENLLKGYDKGVQVSNKENEIKFNQEKDSISLASYNDGYDKGYQKAVNEIEENSMNQMNQMKEKHNHEMNKIKQLLEEANNKNIQLEKDIKLLNEKNEEDIKIVYQEGIEIGTKQTIEIYELKELETKNASVTDVVVGSVAMNELNEQSIIPASDAIGDDDDEEEEDDDSTADDDGKDEEEAESEDLLNESQLSQLSLSESYNNGIEDGLLQGQNETMERYEKKISDQSDYLKELTANFKKSKHKVRELSSQLSHLRARLVAPVSRFMEGLSLSSCVEKLVEIGVDSLEDLVDASLVSDMELVGDVGMSRQQVGDFRDAVAILLDALDHRTMNKEEEERGSNSLPILPEEVEEVEDQVEGEVEEDFEPLSVLDSPRRVATSTVVSSPSSHISINDIEQMRSSPSSSSSPSQVKDDRRYPTKLRPRGGDRDSHEGGGSDRVRVVSSQHIRRVSAAPMSTPSSSSHTFDVPSSSSSPTFSNATLLAGLINSPPRRHSSYTPSNKTVTATTVINNTQNEEGEKVDFGNDDKAMNQSPKQKMDIDDKEEDEDEGITMVEPSSPTPNEVETLEKKKKNKRKGKSSTTTPSNEPEESNTLKKTTISTTGGSSDDVLTKPSSYAMLTNTLELGVPPCLPANKRSQKKSKKTDRKKGKSTDKSKPNNSQKDATKVTKTHIEAMYDAGVRKLRDQKLQAAALSSQGTATPSLLFDRAESPRYFRRSNNNVLSSSSSSTSSLSTTSPGRIRSANQNSTTGLKTSSISTSTTTKSVTCISQPLQKKKKNLEKGESGNKQGVIVEEKALVQSGKDEVVKKDEGNVLLESNNSYVSMCGLLSEGKMDPPTRNSPFRKQRPPSSSSSSTSSSSLRGDHKIVTNKQQQTNDRKHRDTITTQKNQNEELPPPPSSSVAQAEVPKSQTSARRERMMTARVSREDDDEKEDDVDEDEEKESKMKIKNKVIEEKKMKKKNKSDTSSRYGTPPPGRHVMTTSNKAGHESSTGLIQEHQDETKKNQTTTTSPPYLAYVSRAAMLQSPKKTSTSSSSRLGEVRGGLTTPERQAAATLKHEARLRAVRATKYAMGHSETGQQTKKKIM